MPRSFPAPCAQRPRVSGGPGRRGGAAPRARPAAWHQARGEPAGAVPAVCANAAGGAEARGRTVISKEGALVEVEHDNRGKAARQAQQRVRQVCRRSECRLQVWAGENIRHASRLGRRECQVPPGVLAPARALIEPLLVKFNAQRQTPARFLPRAVLRRQFFLHRECDWRHRMDSAALLCRHRRHPLSEVQVSGNEVLAVRVRLKNHFLYPGWL
jgi:hypothetical protein